MTQFGLGVLTGTAWCLSVRWYYIRRQQVIEQRKAAWRTHYESIRFSEMGKAGRIG